MICTGCRKEREIYFPQNKDYENYTSNLCKECFDDHMKETEELEKVIASGELKPFAELLITEDENGDVICKEMK